MVAACDWCCLRLTFLAVQSPQSNFREPEEVAEGVEITPEEAATATGGFGVADAFGAPLPGEDTSGDHWGAPPAPAGTRRVCMCMYQQDSTWLKGCMRMYVAGLFGVLLLGQGVLPPTGQVVAMFVVTGGDRSNRGCHLILKRAGAVWLAIVLLLFLCCSSSNCLVIIRVFPAAGFEPATGFEAAGDTFGFGGAPAAATDGWDAAATAGGSGGTAAGGGDGATAASGWDAYPAAPTQPSKDEWGGGGSGGTGW